MENPLVDPLDGSDVNLAICGMFMTTTLRAAVHLGKDYDMSLRLVKNYLGKTTRKLFQRHKKLISGQTETTGICLINFKVLRWYRQAYCTAEFINFPLPKSVFSDSVLFFGKSGR